MKRLNIIFRVHHPFQFRRYRFFDIGREHYYFDDFTNKTGTEKLAQIAYLPLNGMLLRNLQQQQGSLKVSFYLSGSAVELFNQFSPEVTASFSALYQTGFVEFLGGTWAHSLSSAYNKHAFRDEVVLHKRMLQKSFNVHPKTFFNGELIYSDEIGAMIHSLGFDATLAEGSRHLLGWRNPDMLYANSKEPALRLLMLHPERHQSFLLSNSGNSGAEISPKSLVEQLEFKNQGEQSVTLLFDYSLFAGDATHKNGAFDFLNQLLRLVSQSTELICSTPAETVQNYPPVALLGVPHPAMWSGGDPHESLFPGNDLQSEALHKLYALSPFMRKVESESLQLEWASLQSSDHFKYMSTRWFENLPKTQINPWTTAHEAFINYMNIVSDLTYRIVPKGKRQSLNEADKLEEKLKRQKIQLKKYKSAISKMSKQKDNPITDNSESND